MLQPAGDLGLQHEPPRLTASSACFLLDLLERDLAMQFLILGHEDLAQAAFGMRA